MHFEIESANEAPRTMRTFVRLLLHVKHLVAREMLDVFVAFAADGTLEPLLAIFDYLRDDKIGRFHSLEG